MDLPTLESALLYSTYLFGILMVMSGIFVLLIGMLTVGSWALRSKRPADESNRINRIRLWWFAVSAPHRFAKCQGFTWLQGDERDNLKDSDWSKGE